MSVEIILVEDRVVVGERLGETRQPGGGYLLQGGLVRLMPDATHVDCYSVVSVVHCGFTRRNDDQCLLSLMNTTLHPTLRLSSSSSFARISMAIEQYVIGCLHDRANIEQTSSKHRSNIEVAQAGPLEPRPLAQM